MVVALAGTVVLVLTTIMLAMRRRRVMLRDLLMLVATMLGWLWYLPGHLRLRPQQDGLEEQHGEHHHKSQSLSA